MNLTINYEAVTTQILEIKANLFTNDPTEALAATERLLADIVALRTAELKRLESDPF